MKNGLLSCFVLLGVVFSFPVWLHGRDLSQKSGDLGQKSGQPNKGATHNSPTISQSTGSFKAVGSADKHKSFHDKHHKNHPSSQSPDYNARYPYKKHDKSRDRRHSGYYKHHYPYYFPPYYVSYGYSYYPDYYLYEDAVSPYGYGTTLGTSLERPSNLEVNRFEDKGGERVYVEQAGTEPYAEGVYGIYAESYVPPPREGEAIYIWVDKNGVENYVNDLDLVPLQYMDSIRIFGE